MFLTRVATGFGTVIEVRINRMSQSKIPFGFVVFDSEVTAQKVLAQKVLCQIACIS